MNLLNVRILHPQQLLLPTSFPSIFPHYPETTFLSTFSSLSSNPPNVTARLKTASDDAKRLSTLEYREDLYNSISEISSYFEEDYEDLE
jgi:hypothetical protein